MIRNVALGLFPGSETKLNTRGRVAFGSQRSLLNVKIVSLRRISGIRGYDAIQDGYGSAFFYMNELEHKHD